MTWFKVDDRLHSHLKARRAGVAAMGLWALAGSHCAAHLTDGFVAADVPSLLAGASGEKLAQRLVTAGLWHTVEGGWQFHDWSEYQPTAERVRAERKANAERIKRHRNAVGNAPRNGVTPTVTNGVGTEAPSRPVPYQGGDSAHAREPAPPPQSPPAVRLPTVEHPNAIAADEALYAMRRGSGGLLGAIASAPQLRDLQDLARTATPPLVEADFELLGRAFAEGHALAWRKTPPDVGYLIRNGGEHLFAGLAEARAWQASQRPAPAPTVKLIRHDPPPADPETMGSLAREALAVMRGGSRG